MCSYRLDSSASEAHSLLVELIRISWPSRGSEGSSVLHIDRPCHVCHRPDGAGWMWHCLCSGPLAYTATAPTWSAAYTDADTHMRTAHPTSVVVAPASTVAQMPVPAPALALVETSAVVLREVA